MGLPAVRLATGYGSAQASLYGHGVADRALLLALDSTDPPWDHDGPYFRDALLGANYWVPILWLSLFDADDLVTWPGIHDGSPFTALIQPRGGCATSVPTPSPGIIAIRNLRDALTGSVSPAGIAVL